MNKLGWIALVPALLAVPLPVSAACGDGAIDGTDVCDDGNVVPGDGCSASCTVESGFTCRTQTHLTVMDGSFEMFDPSVGGPWTLDSGTIDWVDGSAFGMCEPAGDGNRSIDMNGSSRGQLSQDLPTVSGTRYAVTFLGDANCVETSGDPCTRTCIKRLTVTVSDAADATHTPFATSVYDQQGGSMVVPWQNQRFEFVARSAMTRLTFTGSDPSFAGPMIDRVAVPASICDADTCGNGVLNGSETCDDGNHRAGDGCSATCQTEPGYTCATAGSACTTTCGDGIVAGAEQCDDGGTTPGDGCSATCTVEPGFSCVLDPFTNLSVCMMTCGNGTIDPGEQCDDHNTVDHDACSNTCLLGPGEPCLVDSQCNLGACSAGGFHCLGCYDTAGPGMTDYNCTPGGPICDTSGPVPLCVGCVVDADCPASDVCDGTAHACNAGTRPDAGVDAGSVDAGHDGGTDGGTDAGRDAGPGNDAGNDAGSDAGPRPDAGMDASVVMGDAGPHVGGVSGGACSCSMHARPRGTAWLTLLALGAITRAVRRRRRARD